MFKRAESKPEVQANLAEVAQKLAQSHKATVVITGKEDIVADGQKVCRVGNGDPMMTSVVGTGCMAASVIGAFAAVEPDLALAAACALSCYGVAAELAVESASGPASFKQQLFDRLYRLDRETLEKRQKVESMS